MMPFDENSPKLSDEMNQKSSVLSSLWLLTQFEYSRNKVRFSRSRQKPHDLLFSNRTWLTLVVATVILGLIASSVLSNPEKLVAVVLIPWTAAAISYVTSTSSGTIRTRQTDWWLSYPYPRWMLTLSKWIASTLHGARMYGIMMGWAFFVYVVAWTVHPHTWMPTRELLVFTALAVLTVVISLPVLNAVGMFSLALAEGFSRVFQPLVTVVLWAAFSSSMFLMNIATNNNLIKLLLTLAILFVAGWPLSALMLWWTTRRLNTLAGVVGRSSPASPLSELQARKLRQSSDRTKMKLGPSSKPGLYWIYLYEKFSRQPTAPAWSMFFLYASQMRWFGKGADLRIRGAVVIAPSLGFIAGVLLDSKRLLVYVPAASLLLAAWIALWIGLSFFQKYLRKSAGWVLSFPVSRVSLIVTLSLAGWIRLASIAVAGEAGLWLGIGTHALVSPLSADAYSMAEIVMLRAVLIFVALFPIIQIMLQTAAYALRGWWALLQLLFYGGIAALFVMTWAHQGKWLFPNLQTGTLPASYWVVVAVTVVVGYPLAAWFVKSASRNLHNIYVGLSLQEYRDSL